MIGFSMVSLGLVYHLQRTEAHCDSARGSEGASGARAWRNQTLKMGGEGGGSPTGSDPVEMFIEQYGPTLSKLGFGGIAGICTAVCVKKLGREAAYVGGLGFICLQAMAYYGYINIDYGKVSKDVQSAIDADGDGKLTVNDFKVYWREFKKILTFNIPGMGGFSSGFLIGLRYL